MAFDPMHGWTDSARLRDGRCVLIRQAHPSDAELVQTFVRGLSAASRYERFFLAYRELPPSLLDRIVGADPRQGASLVALASGDDGVAVVGLAQYGLENDSDAAEVGVVVGERWRRTGLATRLLRSLAQFAAAHGLAHVHAEILRDNAAALGLAAKFGLNVGRSVAGPAAVRVSRPLTAAQVCC